MQHTSRAYGVGLWAALLFASCAAAAAQRPAAPRPSPAGPSLEATAWAVTDSLGGLYVFEFGPGGRFTSTSSAGVKTQGAWRQAGDSVAIEVSRLFSQYTGKFAGRKMTGRARSRSGSVLTWSASRQEAAPAKDGAAFPNYPPIARAARAHGVAVVDVQVGAGGGVTSAVVVSGHPLLQQASVNAARLWKFAPGGKAGETRAVRLHFTFRVVPWDCRRREALPDPGHTLLSAYQAEVAREMLCVQ